MSRSFKTSKYLALMMVLVLTAGMPLKAQFSSQRGSSDSRSNETAKQTGPSYDAPARSASYPQGSAPRQRGYTPHLDAEAPTLYRNSGGGVSMDTAEAEFKTAPPPKTGAKPVMKNDGSSPVKFHYQRPVAAPSERRTTNVRPQRINFPPSPLDTSRRHNSADHLPGGSARVRRISTEEFDFRQPIQRTAQSLDEFNAEAEPEQLIEIPVRNGAPNDSFRYHEQNGMITLVARQAPISSILGLIAQQHGLNIVTSEDVNCNVTVTLHDVSLDDALSAILNVNGYAWVQQKNILLISRIVGESSLSPVVQGRQVAVFPLNFISAVEVEAVVEGLLSPAGQSFISQTDATMKLKTREQIIVEDLPEYVSRIEQCIYQLDQPPRQVLVEAHVLQVTLKDDYRNGVNFDALMRVAGADVSLRTAGFANPASSPAFFLGVEGTDLDVLVEALQTTTDAKTLASPRVLVINGQEARIQIGAQLGYLVTTTTQTSTLQEVNFLDLGVVFKFTPQISEDNRVLLNVKPEVSSGRINPDTGLPEEDTTEVQTTIMLNDGQGMIIGGLIKEGNSDTQSKIPLLGDVWLVGKLFQRQTRIRERNEIIIALVPRIVPYDPHYCLLENDRLQEASTPLMDKKLTPNPRPWEGQRPDAMTDPRRLDARRVPHAVRNLREDHPNSPRYYLPSVIEKREDEFGNTIYSNETSPLSTFEGPIYDATDGEPVVIPSAVDPKFSGATARNSPKKTSKIRPLFRRR